MIDQALPSITDLSNLEPSFAARLAALVQASAGQVRIVSAFRTPQQQQALHDQAAAQFGPNAPASWAAQPGQSNHEKGLAVDIAGNLAVAHKLLPQFGLVAPMAWEDHHIEPAGVQTNPAAYTQAPPGFPEPTSPAAQTSTQAHLAALAQALSHLDPEDQQAVRAGHPTSGGGPSGLSPEDQGSGSSAASSPAVAAPTTAASPVASPITLPTPVMPSAETTAQVIQSPTQATGTNEILTGQPITDTGVTPDQVNAAAGAAGVIGNPSGVGHIQTTPQRVSFAKALIGQLNSMGVPVPDTPENERLFVAWQQGEGTRAAFNPLATTSHAPGSTAFNDNHGDPVQNFTSFEQGVQMTAHTLLNGHYANILAALSAGNSAVAVAQAIAASPWGTGGLVLKILQGG